MPICTCWYLLYNVSAGRASVSKSKRPIPNLPAVCLARLVGILPIIPTWKIFAMIYSNYRINPKTLCIFFHFANSEFQNIHVSITFITHKKAFDIKKSKNKRFVPNSSLAIQIHTHTHNPEPSSFTSSTPFTNHREPPHILNSFLNRLLGFSGSWYGWVG